MEKPVFIEKIIERPKEIYVDEEEPEDPNLRQNNQMTNQRIMSLEDEKNRLTRELQNLRQQGGVRPSQNTNIDYSQAIRELSQKNNNLRNQLQNYRSNSRRASSRNTLSVPIDSPGKYSNSANGRYDDLMRKYDELRRRNQNLRNGFG